MALGNTSAEVIESLKDFVADRTFVITGPSEKGFGAEVALALARGSPKRLVLAGRSRDKASSVMSEIQSLDSKIETCFVSMDLSDNSSVRRAAEEIRSMAVPIHGLVNNAGIMAPRHYSTSSDGIELQFAVNHVGHFLLTKLLLPSLADSVGTVVSVASQGYQLGEVNFDDVNFRNGQSYNGWVAYGQSKTANILFATELAKRLAERNIAVYSVHPGGEAGNILQSSRYAGDQTKKNYLGANVELSLVSLETRLLENSAVTEEYFKEAYELAIKRNDGLPLPTQTFVTPQQGAATILLALLNPSFRKFSGSFLDDKGLTSVRAYATDAENAVKLWALSERLIATVLP